MCLLQSHILFRNYSHEEDCDSLPLNNVDLLFLIAVEYVRYTHLHSYYENVS